MAGTPGPATGPVARPAHQPGAGQVPAVPPGTQQPAFEGGVRLCAEQDLGRDPGLFRPVQWSPPPVMDPWLWIGLFVLLSYTVEAVTGFGSLVIALALGALLLPVAELVPVLVPLHVLVCGSLVLGHRRQRDSALPVRCVVP